MIRTKKEHHDLQDFWHPQISMVCGLVGGVVEPVPLIG
jgi:hypothetical protein